MNKTILCNFKKLKSAFNIQKWRWFILIWVFIVLLFVYKIKYSKSSSLSHVFPELGIIYPYKFLSVKNVNVNQNEVEIKFDKNEHGGVLIQNFFGLIRRGLYLKSNKGIFRDTSLKNAKFVNIEVKGRNGGEIFELKLRNRKGESQIFVGNTREYEVTKEYQTFSIPLELWENTENYSDNSKFDRRYGLDAFIIGNTANLNDENIEINIRKLYITDYFRNDWIYIIFVVLIIFILTFIKYLSHIFKNDFTVFISYAHKDKEYTESIDAKLKEQGIKTWVDFSSIELTQEFVKRISEGIKKSKFMLLIASENSINSRFVGIETGMWIQKRSFRLLFWDFKTIFKSYKPENVIIVDLGNEIPEVFSKVHAIKLKDQNIDDNVIDEIIKLIYK